MHTSSPVAAHPAETTPDRTQPANPDTAGDAERGRLLAALRRAATGEAATPGEEDAAIASGLLPGDYGDANAIAAAALAHVRGSSP